MKKILALVMAAAMALSLAACGGTTSTPASTGESTPASEPASVAAEGGNLVGVAMPTKDLQRWNQDGENMKAQLEAAGYTVDLQYAANDIPTQVSQIENMIANGCEVLVIASIDGDKTYNIEYITGDPGDNNINFFFNGAISVLQPYIDAGTQSMSVFKDTRDLAAKTVEMVDALMKGTEPPINDTETYDNGTGIIPSYLCEPVVCTSDNVQELLIDSGYYTEADLAA